VIPRGRPTLDLADVAQLAGVSLATWRRRHHSAFTAAVKPLPGSERPILYDAAQVHAHLAGKPLPPLPTGQAAEDLLTDQEAGAVANVSASTIRADAAADRMDPGIERHGRRWWTRAAAEERAVRQPQYKGRTTGSKNKAPRVRTDHRVDEVAAELAAADAGRRGPVTAAELAELYGVSGRTAERIMARARAASSSAPPAEQTTR
jgi:hypothetical protein